MPQGFFRLERTGVIVLLSTDMHVHTHIVVSVKFLDLYFHLFPRHKYMTLGFLNVCIYVQAICDARRRFVFVSMDMSGATHDSL